VSHDFLKDSANADIFASLHEASTIAERSQLIKLLYRRVYDRIHPKDIEQFLFDKEFLNHRRSDVRPNILKLLKLIFNPNHKYKIVELLLGSGSGKTFIVTNSLAFKLHELLSRVEPATYYGLASGSPIGMIAMSTTATQASLVIFKQFSGLIDRINSFKNLMKKELSFTQGHLDGIDWTKIDANDVVPEQYTLSQRTMLFQDKNVSVVSGHSKASSFQGFSLFASCIDEADHIDSYMSTQKRKSDIEKQTSPTAEIFATLNKATFRRFPDDGLLMAISTPLSSQAFLTSSINKTKLIGKEVSLEDGEVIAYEPDVDRERIQCFNSIKHNVNTLGVIGPTFLFTGKDSDIVKDPNDLVGLRDMHCIVPDSAYPALPNPEIIEKRVNLNRQSPLTEDQRGFLTTFEPNRKMSYYLHFDGALTGDNAAIAMSHYDYNRSLYVIDFIMEIFTSKQERLSFSRIENIIDALKQKGFHIALITTDGFQSENLRQRLSAKGYNVELLSVDTKRGPYEVAIDLFYSNMVDYYYHETFVQEMKDIEDHITKFDHPINGSKDCSDAVVGSLFSCSESLKSVAIDAGVIEEATQNIVNLNGFLEQDGDYVYDEYGEPIPFCEINETNNLVWNDKRQIPFLKRRSMYIDSINESEIVLVGGYNQGDVFVADLFEFISLEDPDVDVEITLLALARGLKVEFVAVGSYTPYQIINTLRNHNIRTISADMNTMDRLRSKHIRTTINPTWQIISVALSMIAKKELFLTSDERVLKDLYELSEKNFKTKKVAVALAMWTHYNLQNNRNVYDNALVNPVVNTKKHSGLSTNSANKNQSEIVRPVIRRRR